MPKKELKREEELLNPIKLPWFQIRKRLKKINERNFIF